MLLVLDKIVDCSECLRLFPGIAENDIANLEQQRWMAALRAQCFKRLGQLEASKAQIRALRNIVAKRERLWAHYDRETEAYGSGLEYIKSNLAENENSRSLKERAGDYVFRHRTVHSDEEVDPGISEPTTQAVETIADAQTATINRADRLTRFPESAHPCERQTATRGPAEAYSQNSDTDDDDADDLDFILKPWLKPMWKWMKSHGTPAPPKYYDFTNPPVHIGGIFISQARELMAKEFLETIGVLKTEAPQTESQQEALGQGGQQPNRFARVCLGCLPGFK